MTVTVTPGVYSEPGGQEASLGHCQAAKKDEICSSAREGGAGHKARSRLAGSQRWGPWPHPQSAGRSGQWALMAQVAREGGRALGGIAVSRSLGAGIIWVSGTQDPTTFSCCMTICPSCWSPGLPVPKLLIQYSALVSWVLKAGPLLRAQACVGQQCRGRSWCPQ